jgi:hypothetical protein
MNNRLLHFLLYGFGLLCGSLAACEGLIFLLWGNPLYIPYAVVALFLSDWFVTRMLDYVFEAD